MKALNPIQSEVWQNRQIGDVFFTSNHYTHYSFEPHFHEHWVIQVVAQGVNEGVCVRKKYRVSTRELVFINPGEVHTGTSFEAKPMQYLTICPGVVFMQKTLQALEFPIEMLPCFTSIKIEDQFAIRQFYQFWTLARQSSADVMELEIARLNLFSTLFSSYSNCRPPTGMKKEKDRILRAQTFLRENFSSPISLSDLSRMVDLSPAYLIRSFQKETGQTPFAFLRNYRIEKSKPLLLQGLPISDVAQRVGFYDQSHFYLHFKRVLGVTPLSFQRHLKG